MQDIVGLAVGVIHGRAVKTDGHGRVQFGHNGLQIQEENDPLLQAYHAGHGTAADILQEIARRFHIRPAQAVDAIDARHQKARADRVELGHNDFGVLIGDGAAAQELGHVDERHNAAVAMGKGPQQGFVAHFRHGRDGLPPPDFHHLGHIQAVVGFVAVLVDVKFHDFQLIGAGFQQNIGLRHSCSMCGGRRADR